MKSYGQTGPAKKSRPFTKFIPLLLPGFVEVIDLALVTLVFAVVAAMVEGTSEMDQIFI